PQGRQRAARARQPDGPRRRDRRSGRRGREKAGQEERSESRLIVLFTDFGARDLYVGQVKAVLAARAPRVAIIDALHDAPDFAVHASAHLLAALAPEYPRN